MPSDEKNSLLFLQIIGMFQAAALQQMGKLKNPATDTIERDLEQAQLSIDILDMLHIKTKGNLTNDEERLISTVLQELKLNYVDELAKNSSTKSEEKKTTE